jgi:uncharacterized membrane protein YjgN (DUF898 family)
MSVFGGCLIPFLNVAICIAVSWPSSKGEVTICTLGLHVALFAICFTDYMLESVLLHHNLSMMPFGAFVGDCSGWLPLTG